MPYIAIKDGLPYKVGQIVPIEEALHWNKVFASPHCAWVEEPGKKEVGRPEPKIEPLPRPEPVSVKEEEKSVDSTVAHARPRGWNFRKR